jgi:hypothetical protein
MGGNARAVDINTGNVITLFGREAYAEQVDLKKIDIDQFRTDMEGAFRFLDTYFHLKTETSLWGEVGKELFLGSASLVWDKKFFPELLSVKTTLGDIDIGVPEEKLQNLFDVLASMQGKKFGPNVTYVGQNRQKLRKPQVNAIFLWGATFVQVDFVGLPFNRHDVPSAFVKFARSSPKEDILKGVKGVAHKYLLMTLSWAASHRDDITVLTDKSPLPPEKVRFKTMHEPPRFYSFSIDRGYRCRLKQCTKDDGSVHRVDGKILCKEVPTSESEYTTDPPKIFKSIFGVKPTGDDMKDFGSFQGLIRLSVKYLGEKTTTLALDQMLRYKLFGPGQAMSRDSAETDKKVKQRIFDVAKTCFPSFASYDCELRALQNEYYARYNEREIDE